jgi:hypothetical protein
MKCVSRVDLGRLTLRLYQDGATKWVEVSLDEEVIQALGSQELKLLNNRILFPWRYGCRMDGSDNDYDAVSHSGHTENRG